MKIALDAMGGDFGPPNLVAGAVMALREYPRITKLHLVGDREKIEAELNKHDCSDGRIEIFHTTQVVDMSDRAVEAVRRKKDSSINRAVDLVKHGQADAVVSAGHTGAAVAASAIKLRTLPGIDRPGIAAVLPTETNVFVLIDAGANIDARPEHLLQYAFMGTVYSRHVLGYKNPTVGLISLGEEDVKGNEMTKEVFKMLKKSSLNFIGNIEGRHLFEEPVEVVVCDGFVGNVLLKTSEGLASMMSDFIKQEFTRGPLAKLAALVAMPVLQRFKHRVDPRRYNGAALLGLRGLVFKSHGSADAYAFEQALARAYDAARNRLLDRVHDRLGPTHQALPTDDAASAQAA